MRDLLAFTEIEFPSPQKRDATWRGRDNVAAWPATLRLMPTAYGLRQVCNPWTWVRQIPKAGLSRHCEHVLCANAAGSLLAAFPNSDALTQPSPRFSYYTCKEPLALRPAGRPVRA